MLTKAKISENGPWVALLLVGWAFEKRALNYNVDATLSRFLRRSLRVETKVGQAALGYGLVWLINHLLNPAGTVEKKRAKSDQSTE